MKSGHATHVGLVRDHNEDALYLGRRLWAVADGMGGHAAGEVASREALATVVQLDDDAPVDRARITTVLQEASDELVRQARRHLGRRGMATTMSGVIAPGGGTASLVFNVGDSRTYSYCDGRLTQVTVDHSEVQELVDRGLISLEDARTHPMRNIVTQCLGSSVQPSPDVFEVRLTPGDRLLICSDGLTGMVTDADIALILRLAPEPQAAADALVEAALAGGGRDNISVIVLAVEDADASAPVAVAQWDTAETPGAEAGASGSQA